MEKSNMTVNLSGSISNTTLIFEGQPKVVVVENWVLHMENLREVMCCTNNQMIRYTTFKLTTEVER